MILFLVIRVTAKSKNLHKSNDIYSIEDTKIYSLYRICLLETKFMTAFPVLPISKDNYEL